MTCQGRVEAENTVVVLTHRVPWTVETVTMTGTVRVSWSVALTTVPSRVVAAGIHQMTAAGEDVLQSIPAEREKVTVSLTMTVSTQAGPNVAMTCVSTLNISPLLSIPTTLPGLASLALTTAATESATRITTDVETE